MRSSRTLGSAPVDFSARRFKASTPASPSSDSFLVGSLNSAISAGLPRVVCRSDWLRAYVVNRSRRCDSLSGERLAKNAAAAAASVPAQSPEPAAAPAPAPTPQPQNDGPGSGGEPMVVDVVAYCGGVGTASGLPLGWGTVAVDTRIFPFGTKMYIPGYGDGVAADRGTAIIGRMVGVK